MHSGTTLPGRARAASRLTSPRGPLAARRPMLDRVAAADTERRNLLGLRDLPEHLLQDIGVTRDEVRHAIWRARRR